MNFCKIVIQSPQREKLEYIMINDRKCVIYKDGLYINPLLYSFNDSNPHASRVGDYMLEQVDDPLLKQKFMSAWIASGVYHRKCKYVLASIWIEVFKVSKDRLSKYYDHLGISCIYETVNQFDTSQKALLSKKKVIINTANVDDEKSAIYKIFDLLNFNVESSHCNKNGNKNGTGNGDDNGNMKFISREYMELFNNEYNELFNLLFNLIKSCCNTWNIAYFQPLVYELLFNILIECNNKLSIYEKNVSLTLCREFGINKHILYDSFYNAWIINSKFKIFLHSTNEINKIKSYITNTIFTKNFLFKYFKLNSHQISEELHLKLSQFINKSINISWKMCIMNPTLKFYPNTFNVEQLKKIKYDKDLHVIDDKNNNLSSSSSSQYILYNVWPIISHNNFHPITDSMKIIVCLGNELPDKDINNNKNEKNNVDHNIHNNITDETNNDHDIKYDDEDDSVGMMIFNHNDDNNDSNKNIEWNEEEDLDINDDEMKEKPFWSDVLSEAEKKRNFVLIRYFPKNNKNGNKNDRIRKRDFVQFAGNADTNGHFGEIHNCPHCRQVVLLKRKCEAFNI